MLIVEWMQKGLKTTGALHWRCAGALFLTLQLLCWSSLTWSAEKIVFTCTINESNQDYHVLMQVYTEAFAALGYEFSMVSPPARRGIAMLDAGTVDGDCGRTGRFIEIVGTDNLVIVEEPIFRIDTTVWTNAPNIKFFALPEEMGQGVRVGYVRGYVGIRSILDTLNNVKVLPITNTSIGMKMLNANRLDFFVGLDSKIRQELTKTEFKRPFYVAGQIGHSNLYPYLTKKHAHLVDGLAKEIKRIQLKRP